MKWDLRFLELAKHISSWSKDPSTKVGAVIFDKNKRIVSIGYNGFPQGVRDDTQRYSDRDTKYKMVVHAEANAILFAQKDLTNCCIATYPFMPCSGCASLIIQSGIKRCIAPSLPPELESRWRSSCDISINMFQESNVELKLFDYR